MSASLHSLQPAARVRAGTPTLADTLLAEQRMRTGDLLAAAHQAGFEAGEREGYRSGWRYGVVCGVVLAMLLWGLAFVGGVSAGWRLQQQQQPVLLDEPADFGDSRPSKA